MARPLQLLRGVRSLQARARGATQLLSTSGGTTVVSRPPMKKSASAAATAHRGAAIGFIEHTARLPMTVAITL